MKLFKLFLVFTIITGFVLSSCRKDFSTEPSMGDLSFSKDTVFLDTIFTNTSSSTYTLKVYNNSKNNYHIPTIRLKNGINSFYRVTVDGIPGKSFNDIRILAKDSLFVFIETTIDFDNISGNPLYEDALVFDSGEKEQQIPLVTLVEDAHFIFPENNSGSVEQLTIGQDLNGNDLVEPAFNIDSNTTWDNTKPYVIYGYAVVTANNTLTIEKGTRIHFHNNSGLIIQKDATLVVNGELDDEVIFEGDRLEPFYENRPGQWESIWLQSGSTNNSINYAIIKNNSVGIQCDENDSETNITNTQIYNNLNYGILSTNAVITGSNIVTNNHGFSAFSCFEGGTYNFTHCTFTNFWSFGLRAGKTFALSNDSKINKTTPIQQSLIANINNSIIYGSTTIELELNKNDTESFDYFFKNCLIKYSNQNSNSSLFDFDNSPTNYEAILLNKNPDFKNTSLNELQIGENSEVINQGNLTEALNVPIDINNNSRTTAPDIGAYQHTTSE